MSANIVMMLHACSVMSDSLWRYQHSPPGSSVHGIFQARILEWVAISSSRGSSRHRDWTHVSWISCIVMDFPDGSVGKESGYNARRYRRRGFSPWVGKILLRKKQQPTPVFLPEKSHGQRSLVGYSPQDNKESDTTDHKHTHTKTVIL